ncbi:MAG: FeoA family protein [Culicoidibacterales bacterium]
MTVAKMKIGQSAVVTGFREETTFVQRLRTMGITENVSISLKRQAPFADPLIITCRGCDIAIRKVDAKNILIGA